jgi:hypothetical protein
LRIFFLKIVRIKLIFSSPLGDALDARPQCRPNNEALDPYLDLLDQITRSAHTRYRGYNPADLLEHDARAQATCTYAHMNEEAERRFGGNPDIARLDIRGLKL